MTDQETTQGEVKTLVTHDFVLDVYEKSLEEQDPDKRAAIVATAEVLSNNIGTYLVDVKNLSKTELNSDN